MTATSRRRSVCACVGAARAGSSRDGLNPHTVPWTRRRTKGPWELFSLPRDSGQAGPAAAAPASGSGAATAVTVRTGTLRAGEDTRPNDHRFHGKRPFLRWSVGHAVEGFGEGRGSSEVALTAHAGSLPFASLSTHKRFDNWTRENRHFRFNRLPSGEAAAARSALGLLFPGAAVARGPGTGGAEPRRGEGWCARPAPPRPGETRGSAPARKRVGPGAGCGRRWGRSGGRAAPSGALERVVQDIHSHEEFVFLNILRVHLAGHNFFPRREFQEGMQPRVLGHLQAGVPPFLSGEIRHACQRDTASRGEALRGAATQRKGSAGAECPRGRRGARRCTPALWTQHPPRGSPRPAVLPHPPGLQPASWERGHRRPLLAGALTLFMLSQPSSSWLPWVSDSCMAVFRKRLQFCPSPMRMHT